MATLDTVKSLQTYQNLTPEFRELFIRRLVGLDLDWLKVPATGEVFRDREHCFDRLTAPARIGDEEGRNKRRRAETARLAEARAAGWL